MSATDPAPGKGRGLRWTAFRAGVACGLAAMVGLGALLYAVIVPAVLSPWYTVDVSTIGADVSRHGGHRIVVSDLRGPTFDQRCNGACDDVRLRARTGDASISVNVYDEIGRCLACEPMASYVARGLAQTWTVAGPDKLEVRWDLARRPAD